MYLITIVSRRTTFCFKSCGCKASKIVFGTAQSMIKVVEGIEFDVSRKTSAATKLADDDEVLAVRILQAMIQWLCVQEKNCSYIDCATIPKRKRPPCVRGMKLDKGDMFKISIFFLRTKMKKWK